jgi:hypothetical protein
MSENIQDKFKNISDERELELKSVLKEVEDYKDSIDKRTRYLLDDEEKEKAEELSELLRKRRKKY